MGLSPRRPLTAAAALGTSHRTEGGAPYVSTRVVLLFKSRQLRAKDTDDFLAIFDSLTTEELSWLRPRVVGWQDEHPWLDALV